jgi:hypothetical protein
MSVAVVKAAIKTMLYIFHLLVKGFEGNVLLCISAT